MNPASPFSLAVIAIVTLSLLGLSIPWIYILPGMAIVVILLVSGAMYFRRMERIFVDVI